MARTPSPSGAVGACAIFLTVAISDLRVLAPLPSILSGAVGGYPQGPVDGGFPQVCSQAVDKVFHRAVDNSIEHVFGDIGHRSNVCSVTGVTCDGGHMIEHVFV